jgi:hypothetical protein
MRYSTLHTNSQEGTEMLDTGAFTVVTKAIAQHASYQLDWPECNIGTPTLLTASASLGNCRCISCGSPLVAPNGLPKCIDICVQFGCHISYKLEVHIPQPQAKG